MRRTILGGLGAVGGALIALTGHTVIGAAETVIGAAAPFHPDGAGPGFGQDRGNFGGEGGMSGAGGVSGGATVTKSGSGEDVTGPVVETPFGPVQVRIHLEAGKITEADAVQVPGGHRRSVAINDRAAPILRQETLAAQSANIDLVSGATFTSMAYQQSLQAALDAGR